MSNAFGGASKFAEQVINRASTSHQQGRNSSSGLVRGVPGHASTTGTAAPAKLSQSQLDAKKNL
jgi:hypothetical protein